MFLLTCSGAFRILSRYRVMTDMLVGCRSETIYTDLRSEPDPAAAAASGPEEEYEPFQFDDGS
jgi:hypothetical protein